MNVIVIGGGAIAYYLARQFSGKKIRTLVITPEPAEAKSLSQRIGAPVLAGDATDPQVLENAGALTADVVLALTPFDEDNLAICQIASRLYHVPRTIALVNDPENEETFHRLGVSVAISATRILSILLEEQAGFEEIGRMIAVAEGNVAVSEVVLRAGSPADGIMLRDMELPEESLIGGVIRAGRVLIPKGGTRLQGGDRLIVIATDASLDQTMRLLAGE
ncbi:MAG: potassium channel family protein [Thermodesulfobacteriota bacterium]